MLIIDRLRENRLRLEEKEREQERERLRRSTRQCWHNMRQRCNNPKNAAYKYYGGRGIKVCEQWSSFNNFLADMGVKQDTEDSIERLNNDGNYEPQNCKWIPRTEQWRNKSQPWDHVAMHKRRRQLQRERSSNGP